MTEGFQCRWCEDYHFRECDGLQEEVLQRKVFEPYRDRPSYAMYMRLSWHKAEKSASEAVCNAGPNWARHEGRGLQLVGPA